MACRRSSVRARLAPLRGRPDGRPLCVRQPATAIPREICLASRDAGRGPRRPRYSSSPSAARIALETSSDPRRLVGVAHRPRRPGSPPRPRSAARWCPGRRPARRRRRSSRGTRRCRAARRARARSRGSRAAGRARAGVSCSSSRRASVRSVERGGRVPGLARSATLSASARSRAVALRRALVGDAEVLQHQAERAFVAELAGDRERLLVAARPPSRGRPRTGRGCRGCATRPAIRSPAPSSRASSSVASKCSRAASKSPSSAARMPAPLSARRRSSAAPPPSASAPRRAAALGQVARA